MTEDTMAAMVSWMPILFMVAIFYFLLYKPQQQARKDRENMLSRLHIGMRVVTVGGIFGVIDDIDDEILKLRVAENVVIEVSRNAISAVDQPKENKPADDDDDDL